MNNGRGTRLNPQISLRRYWLLLMTALAILMVGLLVGPRVPDKHQAALCVVNVHIRGPFGIALNCDSPEFMRLARQPSALLEPQNTRQSRPGLIFSAAALALPFSPLSDLAQKAGVRANRADIESSRIENALAKDFPGYAAYISLNVVILLLSFYVFQLIFWRPASDAITTVILVSICFLLAANDVAKAFIWSPHTQMFNIFLPVFAVWASIRASNGALLDRRFALVTGIITGLGATAYPLFVIVVPCVFIGGVVAMFHHWSPATLSIFGLNVVMLAALTMLPEGLWYFFVRSQIGSFYQHEMARGQVVWIATAWEHGLRFLLATWLQNFASLLRLAAAQAAPLAALLVLIAASAMLTWSTVSRDLRRQLPILLCGVLVSLVIGAFYSSTGLIVWRLAYALLPPLIIAAAAAVLGITASLAAGQRKMVACACVAITLLHSIFVIWKNNPVS